MLDGLRKRADGFIRRHPWLGFPLGVVKKFGEDRAGNLAGLIAFFGFFSLFPLLLAFVAILGIVLEGREELQQRLVDSVIVQFPIIGDQIRENLGAIGGGGVALAIGIAGAIYGGLGGIKAAQNAMDSIWNVPIKRRPGTVKRILTALLMLVVLGLFIAIATGLAALGTATGDIAGWGRALTIAGLLGVNFLLFLVAFKILTVAPISWRDVWVGAAVAGVAWAALQAVGNFYMARQLRDASALYGFFGIVIGLLSWLYIGAQVTLFAAEINVVRARRMWPRTMLGTQPGTRADERALRAQALVEERVEPEDVRVGFGSGDQRQQQPQRHERREGEQVRSREPARSSGSSSEPSARPAAAIPPLLLGVAVGVWRWRKKRAA